MLHCFQTVCIHQFHCMCFCGHFPQGDNHSKMQCGLAVWGSEEGLPPIELGRQGRVSPLSGSARIIANLRDIRETPLIVQIGSFVVEHVVKNQNSPITDTTHSLFVAASMCIAFGPRFHLPIIILLLSYRIGIYCDVWKISCRNGCIVEFHIRPSPILSTYFISLQNVQPITGQIYSRQIR